MKINSAIFLVFLLINTATAQTSSGTLYFTDGTEKKFNSVSNFVTEERANRSGLPVYYENSNRIIPFNKLKSIVVKPVSFKSGVVVGEIQVTTRTNITFSSPIKLHAIFVSIMDELTGDIKDQSFNFTSGSQLLINKIEFDE